MGDGPLKRLYFTGPNAQREVAAGAAIASAKVRILVGLALAAAGIRNFRPGQRRRYPQTSPRVYW